MNRPIDREKLYQYLATFFESYNDDRSKTAPILAWVRNFIFDAERVNKSGIRYVGISTEGEARELLRSLDKVLKRAEAATILKKSKELNNLPKTEAIKKVRKPLDEINLKESVSRIGGDPLTLWERWLKEHCELVITQQAERADNPAKQPDIIKGTTKKQRELTSYLFGEKSQLPILYNKLTNLDWIDKNTPYADFEKIFSAKLLKEVTPIVWKQSAVTLLVLIDELSSAGKILSESKMSYKRLCGCFVSPTGRFKERSLSVQKTRGRTSYTISNSVNNAVEDVVASL